MTIALSKALEEGVEAVVCASTGNTAASAAAHAAAPVSGADPAAAGAVALGKLAQARALGARVLEVRGSFDEAMTAARELAARGRHALVNSLNPYRIEGQKTAAFEIVEELGLPVLVPSSWRWRPRSRRVFEAFRRSGQPAASWCSANRRPAQRRSPRRSVSWIPSSKGNQGAGIGALERCSRRARRRRHHQSWRLLAHEEGVFCEPASAASVAAAMTLSAGVGPPRRLCHYRSRPEGPGECHASHSSATAGGSRPGRDRRRRPVTISVRAPATTANLGPGFDCAAVALDLEQIGGEQQRGAADESHLGIQAFARLASPAGRRFFEFVDRIPRERGLGSSAAVVALGLVAGALAAGVDPDPEALLATGLELEGQRRQSRGGPGEEHLPGVGEPHRPRGRRRSRRGDRNRSGNARAHRRVHGSSPSRSRTAMRRSRRAGRRFFSGLLEMEAGQACRAAAPGRRWDRLAIWALPDRALGATLSGSGPTVIVWARRSTAHDCARALEQRFGTEQVVSFAVSRLEKSRPDESLKTGRTFATVQVWTRIRSRCSSSRRFSAGWRPLPKPSMVRRLHARSNRHRMQMR